MGKTKIIPTLTQWDAKKWMKKAIPNVLLKNAGVGKNTSQIGIEITPNAISIALITPNKKKPSLVFVKQFYGADFDERIRNLKDFLLPKLPKDCVCNLVLHPSYYRLLLVDSPDIPDDAPREELKETMKWRIKDLISESIENVVLDIIKLPSDAYEGRMNMIYVAVAPIQQIIVFVDTLIPLGIHPSNIDILELSASQICLKGFDFKSFACICIRDEGSFVNVIADSQLYLTRNIDISLETLHAIADNDQQAGEQLLMEVQRSMDYYESQLGKGSINQLFFMPAASRGTAAATQLLISQLNQPIIDLNLMSIFEHDDDLSIAEQAHALPSIGAALRGL